MKNLTQVFLNSAPSRFKLPFGINTDVILKGVSNEVRRDKNNLKINKNCYLTFSAIDKNENNKVIAESTFSYFNIDKPEYAVDNFIHQVTQLGEIVNAIAPSKEAMLEMKVNTNKVMANNIDLFKEISDAKAKKSNINAAFTKRIKVLQDEVVDAFVSAVEPYIGDNCPMLNLVVTCDRKGRFLDLPREDKGFIGKVGGRKLSVDSKYMNWWADRNKPEVADSVDIGDEEIIDEELMLADDAQDIEGI